MFEHHERPSESDRNRHPSRFATASRIADGFGRRAEPSDIDRLPLAVDRIIPIAEVAEGHVGLVKGVVTRKRVIPPMSDDPAECTIIDRTGSITLLFPGEHTLPDVHLGASLVASGIAARGDGRMEMAPAAYFPMPARTRTV